MVPYRLTLGNEMIVSLGEDCRQWGWPEFQRPLHPAQKNKNHEPMFRQWNISEHHWCSFNIKTTKNSSLTFYLNAIPSWREKNSLRNLIQKWRYQKSLKLTLFSASSSNDSASSKWPICMQHTAFPLRISPVMGYFSEKSWKIRYASCIFDPPWHVSHKNKS